MTQAATQLIEQYHRLSPDERVSIRDVLLHSPGDYGDYTEAAADEASGHAMAELDRQEEEWSKAHAPQTR